MVLIIIAAQYEPINTANGGWVKLKIAVKIKVYN